MARSSGEGAPRAGSVHAEELVPEGWIPFLRALDETGSAIVVFTGDEHRLAFLSEAAAEVTGPRAVGRRACEVFADYPEYLFSLERVWSTAETIKLEHTPIKLAAGGRTRASVLVDFSLSPIRGSCGEVLGVLCQAYEPSDRLAIDEQLRVATALSRVGVEVTRSLDVEKVTTAVTRLAAEVFSGWGLLDLWQPDGTLLRAATGHYDPTMQPLLQQLPKHPRISGRPTNQESFAAQAARTGEVFFGELDTDRLVALSSSVEQADLMRRLRPRYFMAVPVELGPRRLGALSIVRPQGAEAFLPTDLTILEQFAERAAIGLAHARDYSEQRQAALTLQRSLLPPPPRLSERVSLAVRYRAGGAGAEVGGDWYDIVDLGEGALGIAVGDVEGHDLDAAALMGQVRAIVHSHARAGLPPARIAREANEFVADSGVGRLVTFTYIQVHPESGTLLWVRAGHVPAVAVPPSGPLAVLSGRGGLPLGLGPGGLWYEEATSVPGGSLVAVFTDGLVESPERPIEDGLQRVADLLSSHRGADVDVLADLLVDSAFSGSVRDDVALVLLRLPDRHDEQTRGVLRRLPPTASSAPVARRFLSDLLAGWDTPPDVVEDATLLVTELVSNATRHADEYIEVRLDRRDRGFRVGVYDDSHRLPIVSEPGIDEPSGRGLHLVEALSSSWGVEPEDGGKVVWFEMNLPPVDQTPL